MVAFTGRFSFLVFFPRRKIICIYRAYSRAWWEPKSDNWVDYLGIYVWVYSHVCHEMDRQAQFLLWIVVL